MAVIEPGTHEPLLTRQDIARHLNIHPDTVKLWARKGKIPVHRLTERTYRYRLSEVRKALGLAEEMASK